MQRRRCVLWRKRGNALHFPERRRVRTSTCPDQGRSARLLTMDDTHKSLMSHLSLKSGSLAIHSGSYSPEAALIF